MSQHVALTFSLKYLVNFAKSTSLSDTVQLMLSNDVPLLVCIFLLNLVNILKVAYTGLLQLWTWPYPLLLGT